MKSLKSILEASILADIDDQLEAGDEALKSVIIEWLKENVKSIQENKIKINIDTTPITVNYNGTIQFKNNITSLTNGVFQWGEIKGGYFYCAYCNSLKSLEGAPKEVGESFYCNNCESLESLEGAPKKVGGDFNCYFCKSIKSLKGAPNKVGGTFRCKRCNSLESLEGAPKEVGENFGCSFCKSLKSLEGAPKKVGKDFYCNDCTTTFTENDVKKVSKVKGEIYC